MNTQHHNNRHTNRHHNRHSPRLPEYDYSQNGAYFVTICAHNRKLFFEDEHIKKIIEVEWLNTSRIRRDVIIDEFVVMPNHLHGIIIINADFGDVCKKGVCNTPLRPQFRSPSKTLGSIIRGFKAATTSKINKIHHTSGLPVWQRNYYEHVIRNDNDLYDARKYINENPLKWALDKNNPTNFEQEEV
ncbi:MAG: transposase [candidate division Zixibacteria bacterium]|nr:transposase [candidate division Zixibacteria bacterium]